ncbi:MAG: DivIVA domain-containing protein [Clostridia bacterium]|nr:DivIVA domain-containing protein [Clostridia bacterium]
MKTPDQIRDMEFQKSTMGGYKQSDVELFLEEVASQIEILLKQKNDAERKLQEVSKNAPEAALSTASIQSVLVNAQRVADQVTEDAKQTAEGIIAEANLKLTEADVKAREIIADAEKRAVMLGETAEIEAAKIIAAAVADAERIVVEAKESVELEQKLYDRLKIEVSDFRKKAAAQCSALVELINQLPGEIPFNMERSKTVLAVDFSNPEQLLKAAVDERLKKEQEAAAAAAAEEVKVEEPEVIAEPQVTEAEEKAEVISEFEAEEVTEVKEPEVEEKAEETEDDTQLAFGADTTVEVTAEDDTKEVVEEKADEEEEEDIPFAVSASNDDQPQKPKGHIGFAFDDDDDDDEDDEPRLFFRRKKK